MDNLAGWIKLYRQIMSHSIYFSKEEPFDKFHAWVDLLMMANYEPKEIILRSGKIIEIGRGSMLVSETFLAKRWQWSRGKIRRYIGQLVSQHMVQVVGTADGTTITLVNFEKFQGQQTTDGTGGRNENGTEVGTLNKNIKKKRSKEKILKEKNGWRKKGHLFSTEGASFDLEEFERKSLFDD